MVVFFHLFLLHYPLTMSTLFRCSVKSPITIYPWCIVDCSWSEEWWGPQRTQAGLGVMTRTHGLCAKATLTAGADRCWQGSEWERRTAAPLTWANADVVVMGHSVLAARRNRQARDNKAMCRNSNCWGEHNKMTSLKYSSSPETPVTAEAVVQVLLATFQPSLSQC